jgi:hypothetical protein
VTTGDRTLEGGADSGIVGWADGTVDGRVGNVGECATIDSRCGDLKNGAVQARFQVVGTVKGEEVIERAKINAHIKSVIKNVVRGSRESVISTVIRCDS